MNSEKTASIAARPSEKLKENSEKQNSEKLNSEKRTTKSEKRNSEKRTTKSEKRNSEQRTTKSEKRNSEKRTTTDNFSLFTINFSLETNHSSLQNTETILYKPAPTQCPVCNHSVFYLDYLKTNPTYRCTNCGHTELGHQKVKLYTRFIPTEKYDQIARYIEQQLSPDQQNPDNAIATAITQINETQKKYRMVQTFVDELETIKQTLQQSHNSSLSTFHSSLFTNHSSLFTKKKEV